MSAQRDRVVLLRRAVHGESDLIVTLFGAELGKLTAFVRGARRSKKRFGAALGWFTIASAELSRRPGAELFTFSSATTLRAHVALAADPATLAHASYATEITRELVAQEQPEPGAHGLLLAFYEHLTAAGASRFALRCFELALLAELGIAPSFDHCAVCGKTDLGRGAVLDAHGGGVSCVECAVELRGSGARPLGDAARALLSLAAASGRAWSSPASGGFDAASEREAQLAIAAILSRYISAPLRSLEFIAKMNAAGH